MTSNEFFEQLDSRIAKHDLLCHPFYKAWSAGELTRDDLREYARDYYHHVEAFPTYLAEFGIRLDEGELRQAVLSNMADEKGLADDSGQHVTPHSELWLDFIEGMDGDRDLHAHKPVAEVSELTKSFHRVAAEGTPEEALAAFYAYESQIPRVAREKAKGLQNMYGADEKTRGYFTLHSTADVYHSELWRKQLGKRIESNPETAERALGAGENAAKALWRALDGIEAQRLAKAA
jgi:pyrroloquinoline-quinone synthase